MDEAHSPELRGRMYAELATYLYPKRKAVELAGDPANSVQTNNKLIVEFVRARADDRRRHRPQRTHGELNIRPVLRLLAVALVRLFQLATKESG
jgi:hypothetical protein